MKTTEHDILLNDELFESVYSIFHNIMTKALAWFISTTFSEGGDYSLDNIQIVWHGVNAFKSNWTMEFLLECSKHIVENNN